MSNALTIVMMVIKVVVIVMIESVKFEKKTRPAFSDSICFLFTLTIPNCRLIEWPDICQKYEIWKIEITKIYKNYM